MIAAGALLGMLATAGILLVVLGMRRRPDTPAEHPTLSGGLTDLGHRLSLTRTEQVRAAAAAGAGLLLATLTGWVVLVLVLPFATIGLPRLLANNEEKHKIEVLDALQDWTRALSGVLTGAGSGLTDALVGTLRSAPAPIRPQTENLVARLQARRPARDALLQWADEIGTETGDMIAMVLIMGARETGANLAKILTNLAESVQDQVKERRQIEAEQTGPRSQARMLTIISVVALAGFVFFTSFGHYYRTPPGQVVLLVVLAMFAATLYWMRAVAASPPEKRLFTESHEFTKTEAQRGGNSRVGS